MNDLSIELKEILIKNGADLVGFADLSHYIDNEIKIGVSVVKAIPPKLINSIDKGPNMEYYDLYYDYNEKLNNIVKIGAKYIEDKGYKAFPQTTEVVKEFSNYRTKMPHKTVATNSGLGWIGKSALLVTEEFGPAVRLSSILTNAPLTCGTAITESKCGNCMKCHDACPGEAISGLLWNKNLDRDDFFNILSCRKKAREIAMNKIGKEITLCGKCFVVCPYTQKYINQN